MNITLMDRSNYFRGLLLLVRKDRKIAESEIDLIKRVGKALGFEAEFCDNAIREILGNIHITDEPPLFSSEELAMKFIKDGLSVARSDNEVHASEEQWLRATAEKNGIDRNWFVQLQELDAHGGEQSATLEVDALTLGNE